MELHILNAQAQIEFVLACTVLISVYGFAAYLIYREWKDNYKFNISNFKPAESLSTIWSKRWEDK